MFRTSGYLTILDGFNVQGRHGRRCLVESIITVPVVRGGGGGESEQAPSGDTKNTTVPEIHHILLFWAISMINNRKTVGSEGCVCVGGGGGGWGWLHNLHVVFAAHFFCILTPDDCSAKPNGGNVLLRK